MEGRLLQSVLGRPLKSTCPHFRGSLYSTRTERPLACDNTAKLAGCGPTHHHFLTGSGDLVAAVSQACVLKPCAPGNHQPAGHRSKWPSDRLIGVFSAWLRQHLNVLSYRARSATPMERYLSTHNTRGPGMPISYSHWRTGLVSPSYGPRRHVCQDTSTPRPGSPQVMHPGRAGSMNCHQQHTLRKGSRCEPDSWPSTKC